MNERQRMMKIAGLLKEGYEMDEEMTYDQEVKMSIAVDNAIDSGKSVTINGKPVKISGNAAARMEDGTDVYWYEISPEDVMVDGQPIDISAVELPKKDTQSDMDRFGPGGGQDTMAGRRTFD